MGAGSYVPSSIAIAKSNNCVMLTKEEFLYYSTNPFLLLLVLQIKHPKNNKNILVKV